MEERIRALEEAGVLAIPRRELAPYLNIPEGDIPYYGFEPDLEDSNLIFLQKGDTNADTKR